MPQECYSYAIYECSVHRIAAGFHFVAAIVVGPRAGAGPVGAPVVVRGSEVPSRAHPDHLSGSRRRAGLLRPRPRTCATQSASGCSPQPPPTTQPPAAPLATGLAGSPRLPGPRPPGEWCGCHGGPGALETGLCHASNTGGLPGPHHEAGPEPAALVASSCGGGRAGAQNRDGGLG